MGRIVGGARRQRGEPCGGTTTWRGRQRSRNGPSREEEEGKSLSHRRNNDDVPKKSDQLEKNHRIERSITERKQKKTGDEKISDAIKRTRREGKRTSLRESDEKVKRHLSAARRTSSPTEKREAPVKLKAR